MLDTDDSLETDEMELIELSLELELLLSDESLDHDDIELIDE